MCPAPSEPTSPESSYDSSVPRSSPQGCGVESRFSGLRGVQWRIYLGILPSSDSSIEELRRVTADSRRRYAGLRRSLLVNPPKDGNTVPDLVMENPLSQNPDSMWGRFFRNAELEKIVDQDLSRLYPEHGSYFQTPACQGMLRRILLLWSLKHPEYGYRQGMHELLAPLLYVLHVDVQHLSQVRKLYEDHFVDKFDGLPFLERDLVSSYKLTKTPDSSNWDMGIDEESSLHRDATKVSSLDELDPKIQTIVLLSDAYGAEGELGILLSERFMEHDAYCMFDVLMSGASGAVAMADFFSPSPTIRSHSGVPPVIEASSALYHLLSVVDMSLHSHLVELGVEPQYFALRWFRVLFGREFLLEDLLIIWDDIFASDNSKSITDVADDIGSSFGVLSSPRGAFISAMAVSMILYLRSSLLATENATTCLQRLLNFPKNINVKRLMDKAKSLQALALDTINSSTPSQVGAFDKSKATVGRGYSLPSGSVSPTTPLSKVPDSYWEEKWRVLHKAEEAQQGSLKKQVSSGKKGFSDRFRLSLVRAESDPSPAKMESEKKRSGSSVKRSLLEDLSRELGSDEDLGKVGNSGASGQRDPLSVEVEVEERIFHDDPTQQRSAEKDFTCAKTCSSGHTGSEENSTIFSASTSPRSRAVDHEIESEKSSVGSNLSVDDNDDELNNPEQAGIASDLPCPEKQVTIVKERKLSSKFQWLWKLGRGTGEGTSVIGGAMEGSKSTNGGNSLDNISVSLATDRCGDSSGISGSGDVVDNNMIATMRNLGNSMLENIQVIESVFQQDRTQMASLENFSKSILVGKGQVTAMAALKELRKISNLLSEM
ncbi:TBC1 domain family member 5 [Telopea speciosissima]|uniref:TBC1 domain family member 5 n=1 Tax=Telopea speciosissima TaxID=54955 RepID=UPI001CC51464|nr:TBC1 domain family member 5 [Telopea speciosissima]XP_043712935.1 TBC1 domain family member 5 [Telopea speciosissima]